MFVERPITVLGRSLRPGKRGRKPKEEEKGVGNEQPVPDFSYAKQ